MRIEARTEGLAFHGRVYPLLNRKHRGDAYKYGCCLVGENSGSSYLVFFVFLECLKNPHLWKNTESFLISTDKETIFSQKRE